MTGAVFKTDVAEHLGQAGSIPVRLRHLQQHEGRPSRLRTAPPVIVFVLTVTLPRVLPAARGRTAP